MSEVNYASGSTKEVQHAETKCEDVGRQRGQCEHGSGRKLVSEIVKRLSGEPLLILFSTGKDSIAAADLMFRYHHGIKRLVYMYLVDGLSFKEKILSYYEKRWNTTIERIQSPVAVELSQGKKILLGQIEKNLRYKHNISWIVTGLRCSDSLIRRYFGRQADTDGIDFRNRKVYPIKYWKERDVFSYCKINKLPLPVEYAMGARHDFCHPSIQALCWLKRCFPSDYKKVIDTYPKLELLVWREENRGRE